MTYFLLALHKAKTESSFEFEQKTSCERENKEHSDRTLNVMLWSEMRNPHNRLMPSSEMTKCAAGVSVGFKISQSVLYEGVDELWVNKEDP